MANILKIYKTQITPAKNALLDNIEAYLEAIENKDSSYTGDDELTYVDNDFQFIKPDLDINIKLAVPKNNNNLFDSIGNYARIEQQQEDGSSSIWYYFIIGSKWTAKSTLELTLSLDTVNTFSEYLLDENNWSEKTSIIREHKDRFRQVEAGKFIKKIDRTGEQISVPYYIKEEDTNIEEPNSTGTPEWYLVYKTENAAVGEGAADASNNKLECFLYPKTPVVYKQLPADPTAIFSKTVSDFENNKIYGITTGGVSFDNILIKSGYFDNDCYLSFPRLLWVYPGHDNKLEIDEPADNWYSNSMDIFISGHVNVGDTFESSGATYTCEEVLWWRNDRILKNKAGLNLPVGVFNSNKDTKKYYAIYIETLNNTPVNKWCFRWTNHQYDLFGDNAAVQAFWDSPKGLLQYGGNISSERFKLLKDSKTTTGANFWNNKTDTNWARNAVYFTAGTLNFTNETPYIYAMPYENRTPTRLELASKQKYYLNTSTGGETTLSCIDFLDRTDPTLVKVLALPYCPTSIEYTADGNGFEVSFDPEILEISPETSSTYTNYNRLKYKNLGKAFGKNLLATEIDLGIDDTILDYYYNDIINNKNIEYETKLLHSDFYQNTFVYDNVNKTIRLEDIDVDDSKAIITPYYQPTNTIGSTMMFKFDVDNGEYLENVDWDKVLISTRANELPIYNNDYLNYLRFGYGNEKASLEASAEATRKAQDISTATTVIGGATAGATLGFKLGSIVPGVGNVAGAIIGGVIGTGAALIKADSAITKTETSLANAQRSLETKLTTLRNSAATVSNGFSAIDLMTEYTDNRLHLMTYDTVDISKEAIYDRLYYCGYSYAVQDKPKLYSRKLFNFIQCDPVFKDESTNVYNYYLADIKDRFNTGITVYHNATDYINDGELMYNWNQDLENWENFERIIPNYLITTIRPGSYLGILSQDSDKLNNYTSKFIPASTNNYRYQITYLTPSSKVEQKYPYAIAGDFANGYTLDNTIDLTQFSTNDISIPNGTKIIIRETDITGEWENSLPTTITVYQSITSSETGILKYFKRESTVLGGKTYWIWADQRNNLKATLSQTPAVGDRIYTATKNAQGQYTIVATNYVVSDFEWTN